MRRLLKTGKDMHSKYKHIDILISLIENDRLLANRVSDLKKLTREGVRIEKCMQEIAQLKAELEKEKSKSLNINVTMIH
jgi:hypothetical protein